ncbi:MAG TPA: hypothetical protein VHY30_04130 [Verrucomicrobiae bacterium]|nr:hypothetical protein [Verrucomicrobiae bacterium]
MQQKIPDLKMKNDGDWYSLWGTGMVIAWVSRIKIWGGIRVWFAGDSETVKKFLASAITPKMTPIGGVWGDCYGSFKISNDAQLPEAVELLSKISSNETGFFKSQSQPAGDKRITAVNRPAPGIYTTLAGHQF